MEEELKKDLVEIEKNVKDLIKLADEKGLFGKLKPVSISVDCITVDLGEFVLDLGGIEISVGNKCECD